MSTESTRPRSPSLVVGIGASAGGLQPCRELIEHAPSDRGIAYVVVMHLNPAEESHLASILGKATSMAVTQIQDQQALEPNRVYVIAPATSITVQDGVLQMAAIPEPRHRARPVDTFFESLARDQGARAVGVVLSGTGHNGSAGLPHLREAGGLCLVQAPASAEFDGMPCSAIETGVVDAVISPDKMGAVLARRANPVDDWKKALIHDEDDGDQPGADDAGDDAPAQSRGLRAILDLLGTEYRVDFRDYKVGTLERRTARRMSLLQISQWNRYLEYLRAHPAEMEALYRDVLIDVTAFFRDAPAWEHLESLVPELVGGADPATPLRIWSAGCASGEEAYSLAMLFLDHLEEHGGRSGLQVFASDISHKSLVTARRGIYPATIEQQVSRPRLRRYFNRTGQQYQVNRFLRETVTFADHNLLADPPFANLDLVSCRNVLIYLESQAQERVLELFQFSLRSKGVLWLGSSETMGRRSDLFEPISGECRTHRAVGATRKERYHFPRWVASRSPSLGTSSPSSGRGKAPNLARPLEQFVLQHYAAPSVAVNRNLEILHFFGDTSPYLTQPPGEVRMDLLPWVKPGLYAKLRSGLMDALERKAPVTVTGLRFERDTSTARIEVKIEPVSAIPGVDGLFLVVFDEQPAPVERVPERGDGREVDGSVVRLLEQELQDTRQELQGTVEQLESANEEYRASHEELLSLNEELQSTNEELETSKEELQSLNEELTTMNQQLEDRNTELATLTSDLNNLLVSSGVPTLFLDRQLRIRRFTPACSELMNLAPRDVGRSFEQVKAKLDDSGLLEGGNLLADIERVLGKLIPVDAEVNSDEDRWFIRRVLPFRTEDERIDGVCITFHEITAQKKAAQDSQQAREYAEAIVRSSRVPLLVLDSELRVISASEAFFQAFQLGEPETMGQRLCEVRNRQWDIPKLRTLLETILPADREVRNYDMEHVFESLGWRALRLNATVMSATDQTNLFLVSIEDVTDLRRAEAAARQRADELAQDHRRKDEFLAMLGHELRNPLAALASGVDLIRRTPAIPERVEQVGAMMARQGRRMATMLDQLLDVGRVISGKLTLARDAVDVGDAVYSAIEAVKPMIAAANQNLEVSLPERGTAIVLGDGVRLAQVVENLLANATKYSEPGGRLSVTLETSDEQVKIAVRDEGMGMEPDVLDHAFDLFTQSPRSLHRAKGGLGLGLPLVRSLVQMHGGSVEGRSDGLGSGSEFVVTLPRLRAGQFTRPARGERTLPESPPRNVMVVEDEEDAAAPLVAILEMQGHHVRLFTTGPDALAAARDDPPEVVLLDLGLPEMDGYRVAEELRRILGDHVVLVAITGYQRDPPRLQQAGFDEHLLKPPSIQRVFELLAGVGAGRKQRLAE